MAQQDPNEFAPIERLLRLKRYEKPDEAFVEDFVASFHERQRKEMLKQSAHGLLWERVTTYFDNLITPRRATAVAAVVVLMAASWTMMPSQPSETVVSRIDEGSEDGGLMVHFGVEGVLMVEEDDKSIVESSLLLSDHFSGGFADEARVAGVSRQLSAPPRRTNNQ